jgi:hypothetical protein
MRQIGIGMIACWVAAACSPALSDWTVSRNGTWPANWPRELEPFRSQSTTLTGGLVNVTRYHIPFQKREDFESAWPHILKVRKSGTPIILYRGPRDDLGSMGAGVRIQCPVDDRAIERLPRVRAEDSTQEEAWRRSGFVELIVDGELVDMNRTFLPSDAPIIDRRFEQAGSGQNAVNQSRNEAAD